MSSLSVSEADSPLSVEVVILSGSLERDVRVRLSAFSANGDTASEGEFNMTSRTPFKDLLECDFIYI